MKHANLGRLMVTATLSTAIAAQGNTRVSNSTVNIGSGGATQTETIDGSGAGPGGWTSWDIHAVLNVGHNRSTGTLDVLKAGTVNVGQDAYVGGYSGSTGTLAVDGPGSRVDVADFLMIGHTGGNGTLRVTKGGSVASRQARVAGAFVDEPTRGDVLIDGRDSSWSVTWDLFIGVGPTGLASVQVSNGGHLSNQLGYIGFGTGGQGDVTVSGEDSGWTNTSYLVVGGYGRGSLRVEGGAAVSNTYAEIAKYSSGIGGAVTITGPGSTWSMTDVLVVGGRRTAAGGTGVLDIEDHAEVSTPAAVRVWPRGIVNLNGGTLNASTIERTSTAGFNFTDGKLVFHDFVGDLENQGGLLSPGDTGLIGTASVSGAYQQTGGILQVDVENPESLDLLTCGTTADLGGLLRIAFNQEPAGPGTYTFLSAGKINVANLAWQAEGLGDQWRLVPEFEAGRFHVEVVPEPVTLLLVAMGMTVALPRARKRAPRLTTA